MRIIIAYTVLLPLLLLQSSNAQESDAPATKTMAAQQAKLDSAVMKLNEKQDESNKIQQDLSTSTFTTTNSTKSSDEPLALPIEEPSATDIESFVKSNPFNSRWNHSGAPHNLQSWKYPVDYLIDPDPKVADGDLVPVERRTQLVPTLAGSPITADGDPGIKVSVWNPGWPLSAQQLRMIGLAINQVGGDHPELPMNTGTRCFCRVVAPIPRCACQNGEAAPILPPSKSKQMEDMLRDIENQAVRAIVKETEKYKHIVYKRRPSVYSNRIKDHRIASSSLRSKRITGEWRDSIQELAHEVSHPSIEDASDVLANVDIGDVACIDSHWCKKQENNKWVASTIIETNHSSSTAGWCVGVGRIVSVTKEGTACVRYETVHDAYTGDENDYHLPNREGTFKSEKSSESTAFSSIPSSSSMMKDVHNECGIELHWMTTNCSDASNVRAYELQVEKDKEKEHALHGVQMQQAALLTQQEVERTTTVLKLLRDETVERAKEYERIQSITKKRNDITLKKMRENKLELEKRMNEEILNNETEGIRNISIAQNIGKTALEQHREKLTKALAYQKKVADNRVRTWKDTVEKLKEDVRREKEIPLEEIEERVLEIQERTKDNDIMENELIRQEKDLSNQQTMAMELMTLQDNEERDERNETKILQNNLDTSYERTRTSIEKDRQHRFQLEKENAKRRILPPIPRPQPFRPTPQCGPTPGWLLTPDEQDEEIIRCLKPLKGNSNVQETYTFLASMFGGSTSNSNGFSSTISDGCLRMNMNVSYFDVLTRIKEREDMVEDALHSSGKGPRSSITDPSRSTSPALHSIPASTTKSGDHPSHLSSVSLFMELSSKSSNSSLSSSISKASQLLGLSINNTEREFGPPDELGKQALIPRGDLNFEALESATSCLCQASDGHGEYDLKRNHNIHQLNGGGCIDQLDSANGMINIQWRSVVRSRIAKLEHDLEEAKRRPEKKRDSITPPLDVAAMIKRIHVQKESLVRATNTLNNELDSRWKRGPTIHGNPAYIINEKNNHLTAISGKSGSGGTVGSSGQRFQSTQVSVQNTNDGNGAIFTSADSKPTMTAPDTFSAGFAPVSDGSCGATLYKAWEQIKILEEEIDKLREDLRKCRAEPEK